MSKGIYTAQDEHVVNILPPVDVTGGKLSQAFSMALASHATIVLQLGVSAEAVNGVTLQAGSATAAEGAAVPGATAIPFDLFKQETAGANNDVLGVQTPTLAAGFVPSANDGIYYVMELDADTLPAGLDYVQLNIANGANSVIASAVAILSGLRYKGESNPTATA
jgi:hypothetical protein